MAQRRSHVQSSAYVAFEQDIVAAQMHFGGLSGSLQLLQMTITKFVLFVSLVADCLCVGDALGDRRRRARSFDIFSGVCRHCFFMESDGNLKESARSRQCRDFNRYCLSLALRVF